jgi:hypothetical protein
MPSGDLRVVKSVKHRGGTKNPVALSGWDMTIALPASESQFTFPMSRLFSARPQKLVHMGFHEANHLERAVELRRREIS